MNDSRNTWYYCSYWMILRPPCCKTIIIHPVVKLVPVSVGQYQFISHEWEEGQQRWKAVSPHGWCCPVQPNVTTTLVEVKAHLRLMKVQCERVLKVEHQEWLHVRGCVLCMGMLHPD